MKMPLQEEILEVLKQKLIPELAAIRNEVEAGRERDLRMQADITVIRGRLDEMDKRFDQVDKRFAQVDKRFEEVLGEMRSRFEQVDKRFEQIDKRFEQIEAQMRDIRAEMSEVRNYVFWSHVDPSRAVGTVRESRAGYGTGGRKRPGDPGSGKSG